MPCAEREPTCCFSVDVWFWFWWSALEGSLGRGPWATMTVSLCQQITGTAHVGHLECAGSFSEELQSSAVLAEQVPVCGIRVVVSSGLLLKSLCWLIEHREGFTALRWRALPLPVKDEPVQLAPAHPTMEGYAAKQHRLLLGSGDCRDIFISPVFIPPSLTVGYRVVSFYFVFLRGTKEERRAVSLLLCPLLLGPECLWGCYVLYPNRIGRRTKWEL